MVRLGPRVLGQAALWAAEREDDREDLLLTEGGNEQVDWSRLFLVKL